MLDDRFWTKVDKSQPSGCWVWLANKNNAGYGMFRPGGLAPKRLAHRLAYEDAHGALRPGELVLHSCDNPSCVNPAHLRAGSYKDNVADMDKRNRRVIAPRPGEQNTNARRTEDEVIAIRRSYVRGDAIDDICLRFGCTNASLKDYTGGRAWRHLLGVRGCPTLADLKAENARRRRSGAKIDFATAGAIRERLRRGETGRALAAEYGISAATVSEIKRHKIWVSPIES